jgi:CheY-like chemotaxis protein
MTALRILHIDDESDIREVVELSLGLDPDFEMRSCSSGPEALAVASDWMPDIILLDAMMPVMDGPATLAQLQHDKKTASIPVVFVTARAQSREADHFRALGAAGVISKPFNPMTLAASVRAYAQPADLRFEELRKVFLRRAEDDAAALVAHRSALRDSKTTETTLPTIGGIAHGLAGAGGIFGFSDISDAAAALEETVKLNGSGAPNGVARALDHLLSCLETRRMS